MVKGVQVAIGPELAGQVADGQSPAAQGGEQIVAASCFLPLTTSHELSTELGTRHRAAIGISEGFFRVSVGLEEPQAGG